MSPAPIGNQYWTHAEFPGNKKRFESPEQLWTKCCEYFQWCVDNPLYSCEQIKTPSKGYYNEEQGIYIEPERVLKLPILRAFTWDGLALHLNVTRQTLINYRKEEGYEAYFDVLSRVESIIYDQKFTGAAGGLLNANIIARDLGLTDKKELDHKLPEYQGVLSGVHRPVDPDETK